MRFWLPLSSKDLRRATWHLGPKSEKEIADMAEMIRQYCEKLALAWDVMKD